MSNPGQFGGDDATFEGVLRTIMDQPANGWVYLPKNGPWDLTSPSAIFVSEEVPPEFEDLPDAGVPLSAIHAGLKQAIPVAGLQDVLSNLNAQIENPTSQQAFDAFMHYYRHDAFVVLDEETK